MKLSKKLLFISLTLISNSILSQDRIEGLGKFKLNKTTVSFIDTFTIENKLTKKTAHSFEETYSIQRNGNIICELFPDTIKTYMSPSYTHFCENTRTFFIPKFTISEIPISNTYLIFYNDTLISIKTDYSSAITEAFELKYGKSKLEVKEKEVNCTLKLTGAPLTFTEKMFYQNWENGKIKCVAAIGDYRDSKCEKQTLSYINFSVDNIEEKIRECDDVKKAIIKSKQDNEKKKKLDGF
jgi:hypothetical protein